MKPNSYTGPLDANGQRPRLYLDELTRVRKSGSQWEAECPMCKKHHLSVNPKTGVFHCFYASCGFSGKLVDFWDEKDKDENKPFPDLKPGVPNQQAAQPAAAAHRPKPAFPNTSNHKVRIIPEDYHALDAELITKLQPLEPEQADASLTTAQIQAQRYLADQGISLRTAIDAGLRCCIQRFPQKTKENTANPSSSQKKEESQKVTYLSEVAIAYVNTVRGEIVNIKYRSCSLLTPNHSTPPDAPHTYSKSWHQESNKDSLPCPPYHIDCLNPVLRNGQPIDTLCITEGEKDALTLLEAGFQYVISVPNGAESKPEVFMEPFEEWVKDVKKIVLCGDTDRPGRQLIQNLGNYFAERTRYTQYPEGCKDISEVYQRYGKEVVLQVIESAMPRPTGDIITVADNLNDILLALRGYSDHGYSLGYGPLTDGIFKLNDKGGLAVLVGKPNCGKTDLLNDICVHLMKNNDRHVTVCSFEIANKTEHLKTLAMQLIQTTNVSLYTDAQLTPYLQFLNDHITHLDPREEMPTASYILSLADQVRQERKTSVLIVDPLMFVESEDPKQNESTRIGTILKTFQNWGRKHGVWVIAVGHPSKQDVLNLANGVSDMKMYYIAGSAYWANLSDFFMILERKQDTPYPYSVLEMVKVRDQSVCHIGKVYYTRTPWGNYIEHATPEECMTNHPTVQLNMEMEIERKLQAKAREEAMAYQ